MERMFPVKEEYPGASGSWPESGGQVEGAPPEYGLGPPRPMEGLHEMGPPPFLTKTFDMVDDGFRKVDADKWEFANEAFLRGQKHLLKRVRRRKASVPQFAPSQDPCVEVGRFGLDAEVDSLRRDKQVLVTELVKLRQQQQTTRAYLQQMEIRLETTERKQKQMMNFLARAMQNPEFLHQLVHHKEKRKELEEAMSKKRRRPIEGGESSRGLASGRVKVEPGELYGYGVSELEALALEMQGFGRGKWEEEPDNYKELDDGFWEELLNEGFDEESGMSRGEEGKGEDVSVLADRLGFLSSSPNK